MTKDSITDPLERERAGPADRRQLKLWISSDVHLETARWDLPAVAERPDYDVMIVAGDLVPRMERGVKWLRARVPDKPVVYVMGNHEA